MLQLMLDFHRRASAAVERGVPLTRLLALPSVPSLARARFEPDGEKLLERLAGELPREIAALAGPAAAAPAPAAAPAGGQRP